MGTKASPSKPSANRVYPIAAPANPLKTFGQCQPGMPTGKKR